MVYLLQDYAGKCHPGCDHRGDFSMVWQYNDTFYAKLFLISDDIVISKNINNPGDHFQRRKDLRS